MHYKITLSFDHDKDGCAWIEEYINVNSLQEAEERIPQIAEDYKITFSALILSFFSFSTPKRRYFGFVSAFFTSYFSLPSSMIFAITRKGKTDNAIMSGTQQPIHESDVTAQSLQITNIAESGTQKIHKRQAIM